MQTGPFQEKIKQQPDDVQRLLIERLGFIRGLLLTLVLAVLASQIATWPFFSIMGMMIISIVLGMVWRGTIGLKSDVLPGVRFSSKRLLKCGIMLMGLRLHLGQIYAAGFSILLLDVLVIVFTIGLMFVLGRAFQLDRTSSSLLAVGTAICGAAAIVAIAPLIHARKEQTALAVAVIAILGTIGAFGYLMLYPVFDWAPETYGRLVGLTLHELAHVVAAGVPAGETGGHSALLVKLGRVVMLLPVAIGFSLFFKGQKDNIDQHDSVTSRLKEFPIPWFVFGFLLMSLVNTLGWLPDRFIDVLIGVSVFLMSMAMAGLGLDIQWDDVKRNGWRPVFAALFGFMGLLFFSLFLIFLIG